MSAPSTLRRTYYGIRIVEISAKLKPFASKARTVSAPDSLAFRNANFQTLQAFRAQKKLLARTPVAGRHPETNFRRFERAQTSMTN